MTEQWRAIPGYEGIYEASDSGRVRSVGRTVIYSDGRKRKVPTRVLAQAIDSNGRPSVTLHRDRKSQRIRVHRLVLLAFVGMPPNGTVCCHNDGDRLNNRLNNLRWDTESENLRDAVRHGTHAFAKKTHCLRGHPLAGENLATRVWRGRRTRACRTCNAKRMRRRRSEKRATATPTERTAP